VTHARAACRRRAPARCRPPGTVRWRCGRASAPPAVVTGAGAGGGPAGETRCDVTAGAVPRPGAAPGWPAGPRPTGGAQARAAACAPPARPFAPRAPRRRPCRCPANLLAAVDQRGGRTVNALNLCAEASQQLVDTSTPGPSRPVGCASSPATTRRCPRMASPRSAASTRAFRRAAGEDRDLGARWQTLERPLVHVRAAVVGHAHTMDLKASWRQHASYGSGAALLREAQADRTQGGIRVEPPAFYTAMLVRPFGFLGSHLCADARRRPRRPGPRPLPHRPTGRPTPSTCSSATASAWGQVRRHRPGAHARTGRPGAALRRPSRPDRRPAVEDQGAQDRSTATRHALDLANERGPRFRPAKHQPDLRRPAGAPAARTYWGTSRSLSRATGCRPGRSSTSATSSRRMSGVPWNFGGGPMISDDVHAVILHERSDSFANLTLERGAQRG
jgi:hypothetical protein